MFNKKKNSISVNLTIHQATEYHLLIGQNNPPKSPRDTILIKWEPPPTGELQIEH